MTKPFRLPPGAPNPEKLRYDAQRWPLWVVYQRAGLEVVSPVIGWSEHGIAIVPDDESGQLVALHTNETSPCYFGDLATAEHFVEMVRDMDAHPLERKDEE